MSKDKPVNEVTKETLDLLAPSAMPGSGVRVPHMPSLADDTMLLKPLALFLTELRHDVCAELRGSLLFRYMACQVYYSRWTPRRARLELKLHTAHCPVLRWWYGLRLWLARKLRAEGKTWFYAAGDEYKSLTSAGVAALVGRVLPL